MLVADEARRHEFVDRGRSTVPDRLELVVAAARARALLDRESMEPALSPVVGVVESFHSDTAVNTAAAAENLHTQGLCLDPANNQGSTPPQGCSQNSDCTSPQTCALTASSIIKISDEF